MFVKREEFKKIYKLCFEMEKSNPELATKVFLQYMENLEDENAESYRLIIDKKLVSLNSMSELPNFMALLDVHVALFKALNKLLEVQDVIANVAKCENGISRGMFSDEDYCLSEVIDYLLKRKKFNVDQVKVKLVNWIANLQVGCVVMAQRAEKRYLLLSDRETLCATDFLTDSLGQVNKNINRILYVAEEVVKRKKDFPENFVITCKSIKKL